LENVVPKLTIITVTLNAVETIKGAISSTVGQTFKNVEYIVIDGGSTDGTVELLEKYRQQNKLRYVSEPDNGIYYAMNKAILIATGEWLYFMGSDDVFVDGGVLERVFAQDNGTADVLYGNVKFLHSGAIYDGPFDHEKISQKNICHQALFVKKTVFDRVGLFNTKYIMSADFDFNIRWMGLNIPSKYLEETIVVFNEKGLSGTIWDKEFHFDLDNILIANNIISRRSFTALKAKYESILHSERYKLGNFLLTPVSLIKNKWQHRKK